MKVLQLLIVLYLTTITPLSANSIIPQFIKWLDDEHYLLYKRDTDGEKKLFKIEAGTGEEEHYESMREESIASLLPEEICVSYKDMSYSEDRKQVIINQESDLYYFSKSQRLLRQITKNPHEEKNPVFSPDGKYVAFTCENNLHFSEVETGEEHQLTHDGSDIIYNGWTARVYHDQILGRKSHWQAFYWSPDSKMIAFLRFDNSPVPMFPIYHHIDSQEIQGKLELYRYPKAGDPVPVVKLGIAHIPSGEITWVNCDPLFPYIAWIFWTPGSQKLFFQQMNREQDELRLFSANPTTGQSSMIYRESSPTWVEFFKDIHFLNNNTGFVIKSNRDGWYNLYHYSLDGELINQITKVDWLIKDVVLIEEEKKRVFFTGTGENNTEHHLFSVSLNGKNLLQLTREAGTHEVELSPKGSFFVDFFSNFRTPGRSVIFDSSGKFLRQIDSGGIDANQESGLHVEFFSIPTEDGFQLPAYWVLPPDFSSEKKYPVIFYIYGGPGVDAVNNIYQGFNPDRLLKMGIIRFVVDHRGSGKFGKRGLDYLHRNLGIWEMYDYIQAVKWLRKKPFIDPTRIGIQGTSYGGYLSALALTRGADYFTHGIACSSVTDWRLYDNVYSERYMDSPEDNPEGYDSSSVLTYAHRLKGKLLILHGSADHKVHLQNAMQLVSKLQDLGKDFELMIYADSDHCWGAAKGRHSRKTARKFWIENFGL